MLRATCAVRPLKRGEGLEWVLLQLGLSETTWADAKMQEEKWSTGGSERREGSNPHRAYETRLPLGATCTLCSVRN
jgi:hypothetical protein